MRQNSDRFESAKRDLKAREIRAGWSSALESVCKTQIARRFINIAQTAELREKFFAHVKRRDSAVRRLFVHKSNIELTVEKLSMLNVIVPDVEIVLFSSVDALLGGVRLPARVVMSNISKIWDVVKQEFCIATLDVGSGLCIEDSVYDENDLYVPNGIYEITAWGVFIGEEIRENAQP